MLKMPHVEKKEKYQYFLAEKQPLTGAKTHSLAVQLI